MKTYEEMAQNALDRIKNFEVKNKERRKTVAKIVIPAVSVCLAAVFCVSALQAGLFKTKASLADSYTSKSASEQVTADSHTTGSDAKERPILSAEKNGQKSNDVNQPTNDCCIFWWKNKLSMYGPLYRALEDHPDSTFAVLAVYRPATGNITSFIYEGKSLSEWAFAAEDERMLPEKMIQLLKEGDSLKYGTALYETGIPSGEKWAKSFYEERISFYGEELLGKYIVDGAFLSETLEKDIADFNEYSAREQYKLAYHAYLETVLPSAVRKLTEKGIRCERAVDRQDALTFCATAEILEKLPLDDLGSWCFDLASDDLDGALINKTDATGLKIAN